MSDSNVQDELEDLRNAILSWRIPMLIVGSISSLLMLVFGGLLVVSTIGMLMAMSAAFSSPVGLLFQIVLMWVFFGLFTMPVQLMMRAAIAGMQGRTNPKKALEMVRLHERYWTWVLGLLVAYIGVVFLMFLMVGMRF
jgi:hypothetical protein